MVTRIFSDRFEFQTDLSSFRSPHKLLIVYTRVCRTEISVRLSFSSVLRTELKFQTGLKKTCIYNFFVQTDLQMGFS